jgi:hypothetical protein
MKSTSPLSLEHRLTIRFASMLLVVLTYALRRVGFSPPLRSPRQILVG